VNIQISVSVNRNRDHILGPDNASVTLVEYGKYECPFCGQVYPIIKQIQDYFRDNLSFVLHNFPLTQVHPHAHRAAGEAGDQNKFWKMYDYLYEHQQTLDDKHLEKYAKIIGLDLERF
jgi:protein-disulfide isomerase